jgi:hypothetical protein
LLDNLQKDCFLKAEKNDAQREERWSLAAPDGLIGDRISVVLSGLWSVFSGVRQLNRAALLTGILITVFETSKPSPIGVKTILQMKNFYQL